jgi:hypothetical protein
VRCHRGPNLSTKPSRRNASDERETLFSLHQSLARCRPSASHSTSRFQRSRRQQGIRGTRTAVRPGRTTDTQGATHTAPPPRTEPKGRPAAVRAHWASNSVNRHERETAERSFAQACEHRPLITAGQHGHRSLPGYPTNRNQRLRTERRLLSALHRYVPPRQGPTCPTGHLAPHQNERHFNVRISPATPAPHIMRAPKAAGQEPFAAGSRIAAHST